MGRVTIGDITEDLLPFTEKGNKVIMVEIVPRKIVEEIIHFCEENSKLESTNETMMYDNGWRDSLQRVKERAEYLLNEFEEGGKALSEKKMKKYSTRKLPMSCRP